MEYCTQPDEVDVCCRMIEIEVHFVLASEARTLYKKPIPLVLLICLALHVLTYLLLNLHKPTSTRQFKTASNTSLTRQCKTSSIDFSTNTTNALNAWVL